MSRPLSRRTVLRGLGTAVALPWLEAMSPGTMGSAARAATNRRATRVAFLFVPNGVHAPDWLPASTGPGVQALYCEQRPRAG